MGTLMQPITFSLPSQQDTGTSPDTSRFMQNPTAALKDPAFLQMLRDFYRDRGESGISLMTDEALVDHFYSDRNWADLNTVSAFRDAGRALSAGEEDRTRMREIQQVWEALPNMFQEGGRGWGAVPDVAASLILDPVNLIGGAVGKGVGQGAARTAAATGKMALNQAVRRGTLRGAGAAALSEGAINAGAEGLIDTALQTRDTALGLQDGFSMSRLATSTALGGVLGGAAGGLISAPGAYAGAREGARQVDQLRGYRAANGEQLVPDENIGRLTNKGAEALINADAETFRAYTTEINAGRDLGVPQPQPPAPAAPAATPPDLLNRMLDRMRGDVDEMRADGVSADEVQKTVDMRNALARLVPFGERLAREREDIAALEAKGDLKSLQIAAQRRAVFERDYDEYRAIIEGGDIEDVDAAIKRWQDRFYADEPAAEEAPAPQGQAEAPAAQGAAQAAPAAPAEPATAAVNPEAAALEQMAKAAEAAPAAEPVPISITGTARKRAEAAGIDPAEITGSGKDGQIVASDVRAAIKARKAADAAAAQAPGESAELERMAQQAEAGVVPAAAPGTIRTAPAGQPTKAEHVARMERVARVSPDLRRQAMAKGVDYQSAVVDYPGLNPDAAVKRAMRERFSANKTGANIAEDPRITRLQNAVQEVLRLADVNEVKTIEELEDFASRLSMSEEFADLGEDLVDYLDIYMQKADNRHLLFDDIDEAGAEPMTMAEKKRARSVARAIREAEPDLENEDVIYLAQQRVLQQRGAPAEKKSGMRSSSNSIEMGSIYEGAGRNPNGRIQSFLRRSSAIAKGSDYGIGGDVQYPMAHNFSFDEALIRAEKGEGDGVIPFLATGRERAKSDGQKGYVTVPKGTILYADAKTRQAYTTERYARYMRGEQFTIYPETTPSAVERIVPGGPKAEKTAPQAKVKKSQEPIKTAEVARLRRAADAKQKGVELPPEPAPTDGDKLLLIRRRKDGKMRMLSPKQAADGNGLQELIGRSQDEWDVAYAPASEYSNRDAKMADLWGRYGDKAEPAANDNIVAPGEPFTPDGPPPRAWEEAAKVKVSPLTEEEARGFSLMTGVTYRPGDNLDYAQLTEIITEIEGKPWGQRSVSDIINTLTVAYAKAAEAIPEGILPTVSSRQKAHLDLDRVLTRYTPEELAETKRLVDRMATRGDAAPTFLAGGEDAGMARFDPNPSRNTITLGRNLETKSAILPRMHVIAHEMGHWAYMNVLTPEDRLEFWRLMRAKYEGNPDAISKARAIPAMENFTKAKRSTWDTPQELFADQFAMYWAKVDEASTLRDAGFWQKITGYIKAIFDRYVSNSTIDPQLEPIFARILPDDNEAALFRTVDIREPQTKAGNVFKGYLANLQLIRDDLEEAISNGSHSGILNAHVELLRYLNALAPHKGGPLPNLAAGDVDTKTLRPIRKLLPVIRDRQKDIFEILGTKLDDEAVEGAYKELDTIVDLRQGRIAAETLSQFYTEGYASFTPERGINKKISKDSLAQNTPTMAMLDMIFNALEGAYRNAEGGFLPGIAKPESARLRTLRKGVSRKASTAQVKAARESAIADRVAEDWATRAAAKYEQIATTGDGVRHANLMQSSVQKLRNRIEKSRKAGQPDLAAAFVLKMKLDARPLPAKPVAVEHRIVAMKAKELENELYDALFQGDKDRIAQASYELTRRDAKRSGDARAQKPLIKPRNDKTWHAVALEAQQDVGAPSQIGIPQDAPAGVREVLSHLTHRSPDVTYRLRKVTYRVMNLMGKSDGPNSVSASDLARMIGMPDEDGVLDFRSATFSALRNNLRQIATGLSKTTGAPADVMRDVALLITRSGALSDESMAAIRAAAPDGDGTDWFAAQLTEHLAENRSIDDIVAGAPDPDLLAAAVNEAVESVAYVTNGMIARSDLKNAYRRLSFYGDMFAAEKVPPFANGTPRAALPHELAVAYANDAFMGATNAKKGRISRFVGNGFGASDDGRPIAFYHGTPRKSAWSRDANPDLVVNMSREGNYGPGFYLAADPVPPSEVYARQATPEAIRTQFEKANPQADEALVDQFEQDILNLRDLRRSIGKYRIDYSMTAMEGDREAIARLGSIQNKLDDLINYEQIFTEAMARDYGVEFDPLVAPVYIRLLNPADFRATSTFGSNKRFLAGLANDLRKKGKLSEEGAQDFVSAFIDDDPMSEAYGYLAQLVADKIGDENAARSAITRSLKDLGYDGMLTTHRNTVSLDGLASMPDGRSYASQQLDYEVPVVFSPEQVKHIDASYFDETDDRFFYWPEPADVRNTGAAITQGILDGKVTSLSEVSPASVAALFERSGGKDVGSTIMSVMRGRKLTPRENKVLVKRSPRGWLMSQSEQMEQMGLNWLAKRYGTMFQDVTQDFAQSYHGIHTLLQKLPDADSHFRAWTRRLNPTHTRHQPESFTKIVKALRRVSGPKNRFEQALTPDEKRAYQAIRKSFRDERDRLVKLGVNMGDRGPDYYPQVWDIKAITDNPEKFRAAMVDYYRIEGEEIGREFDPEAAAEFAANVYNRVADVEADGVVHPLTSGGSRNSNAENLDYSRVINIDKYPSALRALEPYLEDNLESVLTKYFDGTSRRAKLVENFGVNSHGFYDYMEVVREGAPGIARLLSSDKVFRREARVLDIEGRPELASFEIKSAMPFTGKDAEAMAFAKELVNMAQSDGGVAGVRAALERVAPRTKEGSIPITYQRRMDAIAGALGDFGGERVNMRQEDYHWLEDAMRVAMRKRRLNTSEAGNRVSSAVRAFNSVTLLGFTTLTSIPDIALPMIRASSLKEHASALRKLAQDPDYRQLILGTGVAIENLMHDRMLYGFGAPDTKISSAFHNLTGLTPWTDVQRTIAGAVGWESFKAMHSKAMRPGAYKPGVPFNEQSATYRKAARFLTYYGLGDFLPSGKRSGESLASEALMEGDSTVRAAIIRFADSAIFAPNPNDVPLWAQTPVGAIIAQLKSFPLMMMKMGKDVIAEARAGNPAPLAKYMALGPLFGMGALAAKDVVQQRGGEDGRSSELRDRNWQNFAQSLGFEVETPEEANNVMGWYIDGLMAMGGLGVLGELFYGVADQVDNGAYGTTRIISLIGGPTAGLGMSAINVAAGVTDQNDESNAKERQAARELAWRIPFVGGVRNWREGIADAIGGPQAERGRPGNWKDGNWEDGNW